ncbi:hypothetical protein BB561_002049 [Smittium simulii]|uniref:O-methyltransferase domain-containing protein n=1 Tax=Smittium simulii TaxID=133385 RepID=A0A2T9YRT7_9FUNG|nr:hypothetical protein BB561_002049 [Smittium simulii]
MKNNTSSNIQRKDLVTGSCKSGKTTEDYSQICSSKAPSYLEELYKKVYNSELEAVMMITPEEGLLLSTLVSLRAPKVVLELGCFVGYSALWIVEGLEYNKSNPGHLYTIEISKEIADFARKNIENAGKSHFVDVINSPSQPILDSWDRSKKIDIAFLDANKNGYIGYYNSLINNSLLADDGIIVCDNTLFHNRVSPLHKQYNGQAIENPSSNSEHIYNFNLHVAKDNRTEQVLIPIFDGITIIRKKKQN